MSWGFVTKATHSFHKATHKLQNSIHKATHKLQNSIQSHMSNPMLNPAAGLAQALTGSSNPLMAQGSGGAILGSAGQMRTSGGSMGQGGFLGGLGGTFDGDKEQRKKKGYLASRRRGTTSARVARKGNRAKQALSATATSAAGTGVQV